MFFSLFLLSGGGGEVALRGVRSSRGFVGGEHRIRVASHGWPQKSSSPQAVPGGLLSLLRVGDHYDFSNLPPRLLRIRFSSEHVLGFVVSQKGF